MENHILGIPLDPVGSGSFKGREPRALALPFSLCKKGKQEGKENFILDVVQLAALFPNSPAWHALLQQAVAGGWKLAKQKKSITL